MRVAANCGVCVVLAEAWSSVRATAKASAGPRNCNIRRATARCAAQLRRCNAARALLVLKLRLGTFVARLAAIRILSATRLTMDLIRGSIKR